jgi:glycosyltransferase involved in cell wall biosynthesis
MNPQNSRIKMRYSFLRRGIFDPNNFFNSPNCKSILLFDSLIAITFNKKFKKKAIVIPDVIDISSPNFEYCVSKEIAKKSESKNVVSIGGSISKRKGILSFLRAIEGFESKNFLFVVAGKLDIDSFTKAELNYVSNIIETNKDKILFFEERIPSEADFNSIIFQSDIIFASYLDFTASSNLITKAAYFRKPIIVSKGFLMEEIIDKYRLGISINQENKEELNKALIEITSETFKKSYLNNKLIDEYIFEHSHDYLSECLVKVVS